MHRDSGELPAIAATDLRYRFGRQGGPLPRGSLGVPEQFVDADLGLGLGIHALDDDGGI